MMSLRLRYITLVSFSFLLTLITTYYLRTGVSISHEPIFEKIQDAMSHTPDLPQPPIYKPTPSVTAIPIVDNFPLAAAAQSAAELPPIPRWNNPPNPHVPEKTPLFIGFTRNWRLLQQVVVSYIASGWPPEDIYVVENTGVMDSNSLGLLSLQNPFFLNHTRLNLLGVNVLVTPTLFTFAQLQNFYIYTSTTKKWAYFFWSHMDVVAVSFEQEFIETHPEVTSMSPEKVDYKDYHSIYSYCVEALREVLAINPEKETWGLRFFSYDRLTLVNVEAFKSIGAWDTQIPFYMTDCDMHSRLTMADYGIEDRKAGLVYDVASSLDDLLVLYRKKSGPGAAGQMGVVGEVKEASFIDPNAVEEELRAKQEEKEALDRAGSKKRSEGDDHDEEAEKAAFSAAALLHPNPTPSRSTKDASNLNTPSSSQWTEDAIKSERFDHLADVLDHMQNSKNAAKAGRNTWQARQSGGQGEPFYRDSAGFEQAILMTIEHGRAVFREKWGHRDCDIYQVGLRAGDAWRVEHDWR